MSNKLVVLLGWWISRGGYQQLVAQPAASHLGVTAGTRVASCTEKIVDSEDIEFGRRARRRGGAALDWGAIQRICGGADGFE